ncbi:hypothetical protein NQD34_000066 [Periophthalmus magnuspinnatus]|nr:hypothetical protein NQD34_000066 [Periophthalmus magnuspinnatus]
MDQEHLAQRLFNRSNVGVCRDKLKSDLQQRFSRVFEGVAKAGDSAPLTQIYTELYITEGGASEVNQEHEVRHMETVSRRPAAPETTITCEDIFKPHPHSPEPIRAVLTKGVAGVGKTVLTQKLSLDWAEGHAHQDLQLLFPFTFRELNVFRDTQFSLVGLLHHFFSPSKDLCSFQQLQVLFIFDGLDECRPPLDFSRTRVLTDPTESASVHVLLVNLIRGSLLPSARLWITTRPAAANQIPAECVSMVTEVRGFTDPAEGAVLHEEVQRTGHSLHLPHQEHPQPPHHESHPDLLLDPLHSSTEASGTNGGTRAAPDPHTDVRPLPGGAGQSPEHQVSPEIRGGPSLDSRDQEDGGVSGKTGL